jgi:hypothetical protein
MKLAPVVLFVYNRLNHTKLIISALKKNILAKKTDLYIFSDGYKNSEDKLKVLSVRNFIQKLNGFNKIIINYNKKNYGLSNSIIKGVSYVLKKHKKAIILEDDILVSKFFLNYMNDSLNMYADNEKVSSISGYVYPIVFKKKFNTFFIKGADCWGWGTWLRSWKNFEKDGNKLLNIIKSRHCEYDLNLSGSFDLLKMLKDQLQKKNDSWAVRWIVSNFLKENYVLYPVKSFVQNIGNDGSGRHNLESDNYKVRLVNNYKTYNKIQIQEDLYAKTLFVKFFYSFHKYNKLWILVKILKKFQYFLKFRLKII